MSGEDVYDLAAQNYCDLCDAPHLPCEMPDMRYECVICHAPIEYGDECACDDIDHCAEHCPAAGGATP